MPRTNVSSADMPSNVSSADLSSPEIPTVDMDDDFALPDGISDEDLIRDDISDVAYFDDMVSNHTPTSDVPVDDTATSDVPIDDTSNNEASTSNVTVSQTKLQEPGDIETRLKHILMRIEELERINAIPPGLVRVRFHESDNAKVWNQLGDPEALLERFSRGGLPGILTAAQKTHKKQTSLYLRPSCEEAEAHLREKGEALLPGILGISFDCKILEEGYTVCATGFGINKRTFKNPRQQLEKWSEANGVDFTRASWMTGKLILTVKTREQARRLCHGDFEGSLSGRAGIFE